MATRPTHQISARTGQRLKTAMTWLTTSPQASRLTTVPTSLPARHIHTTTTPHIKPRSRYTNPATSSTTAPRSAFRSTTTTTKPLNPTSLFPAASKAQYYTAPALFSSVSGVVMENNTDQQQTKQPITTTQITQPTTTTTTTPTTTASALEDPSLDDVLYYLRRRIREFMNWMTPQTYQEWKGCIFDLINALSVCAALYGSVFVLTFFTFNFFNPYGALNSTLAFIENTSVMLETIKRFAVLTTGVFAFQVIKRDLDTKIDETISRKQQQQQQQQLLQQQQQI